MQIDKRLIPINFTKGGNKKLGVVIHTMVGTMAGTDAWFRNPAAQASSHYGIDLDGETVYQWVEESDQAYAQGIVKNPTAKMVLDRPGVNPNTYMISIENADNGDPTGRDRSYQYQTIIALVKEICARNGIPIDREHIVGHHEIRSDKTCPGNLNVDYIVEKSKESNMSADMYGGLDLNDKASMRICVDDHNAIQKGLYIKKVDAEAQAQAKYDAGFAAGKAQVPTTTTPSVEPRWIENGMTIEETVGNLKKTTNYRLK